MEAWMDMAVERDGEGSPEEGRTLGELLDLGPASEATAGLVSGLLEEPANYRPDF